MDIIDHPSENHGERRRGARPSLVVLHYTAMAGAQAALDRLCAPEHQVSAHWLIAADGCIFRLVDEARRAWHAGAGAWGAVEDVNSASIGIELDNLGDHPFAAPQMAALEALLGEVLGRWSIPAQGVIAHSDLAPARKGDPGPRFDWRRLARAGLAPRMSPRPRISPRASRDRAATAALDRARACPYIRRPADGRMAAGLRARGKSGLHEGTAPGNARPAKAEGKRHRKQTASGFAPG